LVRRIGIEEGPDNRPAPLVLLGSRILLEVRKR
jgi:hypothetical protein